MIHLHASCIAIGGTGVLFRGPSGAGKSDLALRLVDQGAVLVADDRVELAIENGAPVARAPQRLAGLLEVRGVGILPVAAVPAAAVGLVVDLVGFGEVERLPEPAFADLAGVPVPRIALWPFAASAPAQIRLAVATLQAGASFLPAGLPESAAS